MKTSGRGSAVDPPGLEQRALTRSGGTGRSLGRCCPTVHVGLTGSAWLTFEFPALCFLAHCLLFPVFGVAER